LCNQQSHLILSRDKLDALLDQVCRALQLTPTQYLDAKKKYEAVGEWLGAEGSLLQLFRPVIYPQGSMRLGTTNRPWRREEFDLDLVCQFHGCGNANPLAVYDAVHVRLAGHGTYKPILEKKKRCVRLNYAGDFHLDILPACPDPSRGGSCVRVPDCWMPSNPIGFAARFFDRCPLRPTTGLGYGERRATLIRACYADGGFSSPVRLFSAPGAE